MILHQPRHLLPITVGEGTNYGLRNNDAIKAPFTRTESFRRSFVPYAINLWNTLPAETRDIATLQLFKVAIKVKENPKEIYYYGERWPAIHHARTRIGCSKLNAHLCLNLHVIPLSTCQCGYEVEDPMHFYLHCPIFRVQREKMIRTITALTPPTLDTILFGNPNLQLEENKLVFSAIHTFILETE